ncbi:hypothetical protein TELCIR_07962 [Teladorsagia circumcincta]|uniref:Uncharacterized protein n=1 Tax=Teladorsagia circumcincta TaxID=45464 RepID=A0A2G9UIX6_TELCI|nr:hypothetical protein TELCIR_07962 [Teladorsagia circumcincta]
MVRQVREALYACQTVRRCCRTLVESVVCLPHMLWGPAGIGREKRPRKGKQKLKNGEIDNETASMVNLSEDRKAELRERARLLARRLSRLQGGEGESKSIQPKSSGNGGPKSTVDSISTEESHLTEKPSSSTDRNENANDGMDKDDPNAPTSQSSNLKKEEKIPDINNKDVAGPSGSGDQGESKSMKKKKKHKLWREERVKSSSAKSSKQLEKSRSATPSVEKADDSYVLGCLLKSAGVRCAMNHDDLISDEPSGYLVEKEADAVATRAAKSIRRRYV